MAVKSQSQVQGPLVVFRIFIYYLLLGALPPRCQDAAVNDHVYWYQVYHHPLFAEARPIGPPGYLHNQTLNINQ
jgi:hypothetical protein